MVIGETAPALVFAAEGEDDLADQGSGMAEGWSLQEGTLDIGSAVDVGRVAGGGAG